VELGAIFPPVLQRHQQLVCNTQLVLASPFTLAFQLGLKDCDHGTKGLATDTAGSFEGRRGQLLEFFVEHLLSVNAILVLTHPTDSCKSSIGQDFYKKE
jgi:hypothetical protein